jgi:hypothetical protein
VGNIPLLIKYNSIIVPPSKENREFLFAPNIGMERDWVWLLPAMFAVEPLPHHFLRASLCIAFTSLPVLFPRLSPHRVLATTHNP